MQKFRMNYHAECRVLPLICGVRSLKTGKSVKQSVMHLILNGVTKTSSMANIDVPIAFLKIPNLHQAVCLLRKNWRFLNLFAKTFRKKYSAKSSGLLSQTVPEISAVNGVLPLNSSKKRVGKSRTANESTVPAKFLNLKYY